MKKVLFLVDNGFEDVELIAPVDILRRGGVFVDIASANNKELLTSSHNIVIKADKKIDDIVDILEYDALVVPGGMPGSENLKNNVKVINFFKEMYNSKKLVAAICAAPIVLNEASITKNHFVTSYPGFSDKILSKKYFGYDVVLDDNVITASGPAFSFKFGFEILKYLTDETKSLEVYNAMLMPKVK